MTPQPATYTGTGSQSRSSARGLAVSRAQPQLASTAHSTIFGVRWTSTESCSTYRCRIDGTRLPPTILSGGCSEGLRYKQRRLITDGLRSYGVSERKIRPTSDDADTLITALKTPIGRLDRRERPMQWFKFGVQYRRTRAKAFVAPGDVVQIAA